jgi:hypothetical protein
VNARTWISLVNLVAIVIAFVVLLELPQYSGYAFYGLLSWILVGFVLLYAVRSGRSTPATGAPLANGRSAAPSVTAPLPAGGGTGPAASLDFCIYCGTNLPEGTLACPACGHPVRAV